MGVSPNQNILSSRKRISCMGEPPPCRFWTDVAPGGSWATMTRAMSRIKQSHPRLEDL